jgi:septum formation protein
MVAHPVQLHELILASASPRRRALLSQLGLSFRVIESRVDEPAHAGQEPAAYAGELAALKGEAVTRDLAALAAGAFVLAADTIVVLDASVLGKPRDDGDAVAMLCRMQGRTHEVITAVALRRVGSELARGFHVRSRVEFRAFDAEIARRYVASGEGRDKAGSYAVQGLGSGLVRGITGSYSNVVGLPTCETLELLCSVDAVEAWP